MRSSRLPFPAGLTLCAPIQWGNHGEPPVFCLPGAGASVTSFVPLASALGTQTPVYGLQPRGLDGKDEPFRDVQEAAETYLPLIKRTAQNGRCRLIGHSFGGWIAFELARRLEREGFETSLVIVDSEAPCEEGVFGEACRGPDALEKLVEILGQACERPLKISREDFARLPASERVPLLARAMITVGLLSPRTDVAIVEAMVRVFEANLNTRFQPKSSLRGTATLVRASDPSSVVPAQNRTDPVVAWREFAPRLTAVETPGNHMTLLAEPHVQTLANIIHGQMGAAT
jgi:thioesterase domain-containing protein